MDTSLIAGPLWNAVARSGGHVPALATQGVVRLVSVSEGHLPFDQALLGYTSLPFFNEAVRLVGSRSEVRDLVQVDEANCARESRSGRKRGGVVGKSRRPWLVSKLIGIIPNLANLIERELRNLHPQSPATWVSVFVNSKGYEHAHEPTVPLT
jgi:hypothetical protein